MKRLIISLMAVALAGSALASVPQILTYNGVLAKSGGFEEVETLSITFTLYDVGATNAVAVWARQLPVAVNENGVFSTELRDDIGRNPLTTNAALVDALAAIKGKAEIGIRPPECTEDLLPRQRLEWNVRAARAARAQAADILEAEKGIQFNERVTVDELVAKNVTVTNINAIGSCTLLRRGGRTIGGKSSTIKIKGVKPETDAYTSKEYVTGAFATEHATSDMAVTYAGVNGAFTVLVPKGGRIESDGSKNLPKVVNATVFGK